jgi:hypothetical protein
MLPREGKQRRSDAGKPLYLTILEWRDRRLSNAFSERALAALSDTGARIADPSDFFVDLHPKGAETFSKFLRQPRRGWYQML